MVTNDWCIMYPGSITINQLINFDYQEGYKQLQACWEHEEFYHACIFKYITIVVVVYIYIYIYLEIIT